MYLFLHDNHALPQRGHLKMKKLGESQRGSKLVNLVITLSPKHLW
jgi:hypothetical protein